MIAECESGEVAVKKAKSLHPDIVLMDINLPGITVFRAARLISKFSPTSKIVAVSMHTQPGYMRKLCKMAHSAIYQRTQAGRKCTNQFKKYLKAEDISVIVLRIFLQNSA